jgi:hypothetical protein
VLAAQLLADLRRVDIQRRDVQRKLATAVQASGTTVTGIFGVGPAVAAAVIGDTGESPGSPARTTSPPITAPRRSRCPPAAGSSTGCRCAGTGG